MEHGKSHQVWARLESWIFHACASICITDGYHSQLVIELFYLLLSWTHVPKGTLLVTQNQVTSRLQQFLPSENPDEFNPDRWMRRIDDDAVSPKPHSHLSLPFGHGKRACIGRRMAEQSIYVLMFRFFQMYKIDWVGKENLDCKSLLINEPDSNLEFVIRKRETWRYLVLVYKADYMVSTLWYEIFFFI